MVLIDFYNKSEFGRDIFPYIDKYPSCLFSSVKTIWWCETRYNKLVCWERCIIFCLSNHKNIYIFHNSFSKKFKFIFNRIYIDVGYNDTI